MRFNKTLLTTSLLFSLIAPNAEASLTPYTSAGQSLVYSSVSNVTWTSDGNLLGTQEANDPNLVSTIISTIGSISHRQGYDDTPPFSGTYILTTADFGANGKVSWYGAQAYVSYLNTINYAGSHQWALPEAAHIYLAENSPAGSPFGQLFYNELGGTGGNSMPDTSTFNNEQDNTFWLRTEYDYFPDSAYLFYTGSGYQGSSSNVSQFYAWAISPGQVSAVPVPGAVWLFGTGLLGLLGLKRRGHVV